MIVVDTNVLVYLLLPCPKTALAEILLEAQPQWAAPPLWRSEFRNVLTGYLRRGLLQHSRAVALMQEAQQTISAHEDMISTEDVLQLVSRSRCSSYDWRGGADLHDLPRGRHRHLEPARGAGPTIRPGRWRWKCR